MILLGIGPAPEWALRRITEAGGRPVIVGGYVRDVLLAQCPPNDIDVEVFGLTLEQLMAALGKGTEEIGDSFGVVIRPNIKYNEQPVQFSLPRRREIKTGEAHTDFTVELDPQMSYEDAALRRDLTINSLGIDWISREILDPFNGQEDWQEKIARPVNLVTFAEDHLRILRAAQFMSRFELKPAPELIELGKTMTQEHLASERVHGEWSKLLMKGSKPSKGVAFLRDIGWLEKFYPELAHLESVPQDTHWHPEGNVLNHTLEVIDRAANRRNKVPEEHREAFMFAALVHDVGKGDHTEQHDDGKITAYRHEKSDLIPQTLELLSKKAHVRVYGKYFANQHMKKTGVLLGRKRSVRRFVRKADSPDVVWSIYHLWAADGGSNWAHQNPDVVAKLEDAIEFVYKKGDTYQDRPQLPVNGKDIMDLGVPQGPQIGELLEFVADLVDDGNTDKEELLRLVQERLSEGA